MLQSHLLFPLILTEGRKSQLNPNHSSNASQTFWTIRPLPILKHFLWTTMDSYCGILNWKYYKGRQHPVWSMDHLLWHYRPLLVHRSQWGNHCFIEGMSLPEQKKLKSIILQDKMQGGMLRENQICGDGVGCSAGNFILSLQCKIMTPKAYERFPS